MPSLVTRRKAYNRPNVVYEKRVRRTKPKPKPKTPNFKQLITNTNGNRAPVRNNQNAMFASALAAASNKKTPNAFTQLHNVAFNNRAPVRNNMRNQQNSLLAATLAAEYPLLPRRFAMSSEAIAIDPIFKHTQGSPEFLEECDAFLRANIKEKRIGCPSGSDRPKAMVYQKTIAKLFDERTPVRRLLAVAQLGAGKTFMMLKILNNYINRPLAKILIFPTKTTVDNFYSELLKFKNHHRTWLEQQLGRELSDNVSAATMERCKKLLRSPPANTIAPLRCYRVTQFRTLMADTSLFGKRKAYEPLWIVDEVHNLVAPSKKIASDVRMMSNLRKMRDYLRDSKHRLAGFTATPIVDMPEQGKALLDIVKGSHNASVGNHGFVSWYMDRAPTVFAAAKDFPSVIDVPVSGPPLLAAIKSGSVKNQDRYLHTSFYFANQEKNIKQIVDDPEVFAPKLARIAADIAQFGSKTLVLIDRAHGLTALGEILRRRYKIRVAVFEGDVPNEGTKDYAAWRTRMNEYNSPENDHGQLHQVAICDAATYSEGVSFKSVRLIVLAAVAEKYGLMQQRLGRALRSCSHTRLPDSERTLEQRMYTITLPPTVAGARGKVHTVPRSNDEVRFAKLMADKPPVDAAMLELASYAVDRKYLDFGAVNRSSPRRNGQTPPRRNSPAAASVVGRLYQALPRVANVRGAIASGATSLLARARSRYGGASS